jgi:Mg/Co/Ni transporter MgtE
MQEGDVRLFLIALLSVLVGVLIGTLLSQGVIDPFLPSTQMLTIADDYIFLG